MLLDVIASRQMTMRGLAACVLVASMAVGCEGRLDPSASNATSVSASPSGVSPSPTAASPVQSWLPALALAAGPTDAPCKSGGSQTAQPGRPNGWPVVLGDFGEPPRIGANGMSYLVQDMSLTAIDTAGHEPAGWPVKLSIAPIESNGYAPTDVEVGPDGTVYVTGGNAIEAFRPDGTAVSGWPYHADRIPYLAFVASVLPVAEGVYTDINAGEVVLLGTDGAPRPGWPVKLPRASVDTNPRVQLLAGPDGTLYVEDLAADAIYAYSSDGTLKTGWPLQGWHQMTFDPSGRIYVWKQLFGASEGARYSGPARETQIAAVDSAGHLHSGWPLVLDGPVSSPTFGPDGTVYATRGTSYGPGPEGSSTSATLLAFDRTGEPKPGWPVPLPTGYWVVGSEPGVFQAASDPPAIGANGSVYVIAAVSNSAGPGNHVLFAVLPNGRPAPGWPRDIGPGQLSNVLADPTGSGWLTAGHVIYFVSDNHILGLQSDGTLASGWPLSRPCGAAPQLVEQTPDGGLLVLWNAGDKPFNGTLEIRYRPDGSEAGS
jgi:hypothetical protein